MVLIELPCFSDKISPLWGLNGTAFFFYLDVAPLGLKRNCMVFLLRIHPSGALIEPPCCSNKLSPLWGFNGTAWFFH
jgi:hypothetical protein